MLAAAVAALGALMLGEYEFTGAMPYLVGPLFGLAIGEVVASVGKTRSAIAAAVGAAICFGGIVWTGWIDSSEGVEPLRVAVWPSAAAAALCCFLRVAGLRRRS